MAASGLYYTSWKNAMSPGGFDIYAKALDISDADAQKIIRLTRYVPKNDLPSAPSAEEIRTLFPKKYTYFPLDSRKYCIACSTYTGKDCYDKYGNYFVHALVLDSIDGVRPADFIDSDVFKSNLTPEEALATYPKEPNSFNERDFICPLPKDELVKFFTPERISALKKLACALAGASKKRVGIVLDDQRQNIKYWHTALCYILPESIWKNVSFSTYGGDRAFIIVSNVNSSPFINSIDVKSHSFDMKSGALDIKIPPMLFIEHACELFEKDLFAAEMFSRRIEALSDECDTSDLDMIYRLWCIENTKFDVFESAFDLKRTLDKYYIAFPEKAERITQNVVFALSFSLSFPKNYELTDLFRFLYAHASESDKRELLTAYVDMNLEKAQTLEPHKLYESIKRTCICPWGEAVVMLFEPKMLDHIATFDSVSARYFICAVMIDAYSGTTQARQHSVVNYLAGVCIDHVINNEIPLAALILRRASHKGIGLDELINQNVAQSDTPALSEDPHRTFEYIDTTDTVGECFWTLVINCAKRVPDSIDQLIQGYIGYIKTHPEKKGGLEALGLSKEVCRVFLKAVSLYRFEHLGEYNDDLLVAKYEEYMCEENEAIAEKAKRIYLTTLAAYLEGMNDTGRIKTCVSILKRIFAKNLPQSTDSRILRLMSNAMFGGVRLSVIKNATTGDFLGNFMIFLENAGAEIPPVAQAILEGDTFVLAADERSNYVVSLKSIANMAKERSFTFANGKLSSEDLKDFGDLYLPYVLESARLFAKIDEKLFQSFMEEILSHLLCYEKFTKTFDLYLDKDLERSSQMLEYAFDYVFQIPSSQMSLTMQDICKRYLERLSGSKRKKVIAYLCENVHSRTKMKKYSMQFITTHKTIGAKKLILKQGGKKKK